MKKVFTALVTIGGFLFGAYEVYDAFSGNDYGAKLQYGPLEVYYTDDVNEARAMSLGSYLDSTDFTGGDAMSIQLDKKDNVYQFNISVLDGVANNDEYNALFRNVLNDVKSKVFPKASLTLNLTDNTFQIQQSFEYDETLAKPYGEMIAFNGTEVYYKDVPSAKATDLGNYLVKSEFADGSEKAVQLSIIGGKLVLKMIVDESFLQDPEYIALFENFRKETSLGAFGDENLEVHLTDEFFNTKKKFK